MSRTSRNSHSINTRSAAHMRAQHSNETAHERNSWLSSERLSTSTRRASNMISQLKLQSFQNEIIAAKYHAIQKSHT